MYEADGRGGVFVISLDGTGRHRILGKGNIVAFTWSPDGRWIAITGIVGKETGTFVVHPDGSGFRRISALGECHSPPSWSPDSRSVVVEDGCYTPDIWVVAVAGGSQRRLTEGWRYGYGNYDPDWNPRGVPTAAFAGSNVPPSLPTDSLADSNTLRTTHPITRLVADGSAVAVRHDQGYGTCAEVWKPTTPSLTTFPACLTPTGFGFAGDRVVWSHREAGGGVISWTVGTGTSDVPNFERVHGVPDIGQPISDIVGDGSFLAFDSWGFCPRDVPVCTPKTNDNLYRLDGTQAIKITSSAGTLTPLSVDAGRILVDHEDGTMEIRVADGGVLRSFTFDKASVRGARLQGNDLVVQTPTSIEVTDATTGLFQRRWPRPTRGRHAHRPAERHRRPRDWHRHPPPSPLGRGRHGDPRARQRPCARPTRTQRTLLLLYRGRSEVPGSGGLRPFDQLPLH